MRQEYEVGVYRGGLLAVMFNAVRCVFRTWLYAKKNGFAANAWYGVYLKGTQYKVAELGCLPVAEGNAHAIVELMMGNG